MAVMKRGLKGIFYMVFMTQGVRVYRSTGKYTKKEAKKVELEERQKLNEKPIEMSSQERTAKMLLTDAIDLTYQTRWKDNKDGKRTYERSLKLVGLIGNLPIGNITEEIVFNMVQQLEKRKYANATINRYLTHLKTVLKDRRQEYDFIKLKREDNGRIRSISREEEISILELLKSADSLGKMSYYSDAGDMVAVLLDTGVRLSELLNLKYQDINFSNNLISIWVSKNNRARSVPMTNRVRRILEERQSNNTIKPFTLSANEAERSWKWVRAELGLSNDKNFVIHACRHTTATRMVNAGVDLYVVKEVLGHSSITITERYAHLNPAKLAEAIGVLGSD